MSTEFKRVREYEMMVIFHPELSEEDLIGEVGKIEGHIAAIEGTVTLVNRESPWGRRRLAYAIRHDSRDIRDGVYVLYYFTAESTRLGDLEREIKLDDRILRYLLTQQTVPIMEPAPAEEEAAEGEAAAETATEASAQESPAPADADQAAATTEPASAEAEAPAVPVAPEETTPEAVAEEAPAVPEAAEETAPEVVAEEAPASEEAE